jgi:hypothetical protein
MRTALEPQSKPILSPPSLIGTLPGSTRCIARSRAASRVAASIGRRSRTVTSAYARHCRQGAGQSRTLRRVLTRDNQDETGPATWCLAQTGGTQDLHPAAKSEENEKCRGLKYQSQYETPAYRLLARARKIRRRLAKPGETVDPLPSGDPLPPKPRYMRWRTYRRLEALVSRLEAAGWAATSGYIEGMRRRMR